MADIFLIKKPIISERAHYLSKLGKYVFIVNPRATKNEVKKAIAKLYGVNVTSVNMLRGEQRKSRLHRRRSGKSVFKKAIVTLKSGQTIDIMPQ